MLNLNPVFVNILSVNLDPDFQEAFRNKVKEQGLEINLLTANTCSGMWSHLRNNRPHLVLISVPNIKGELANTEEYVGGIIEELKLQFSRGKNAIVPIYSGDRCPIEFQVGPLQWKHDPDIIIAELKKLGFGPLDK